MKIPKPNTSGQQGDNLLPQVDPANMVAPPRADFDNNRFDTLVAQKGVDVTIEKALQCPCQTSKVQNLSTCRNCGGVGLIFVNKKRSRFVMQSMDLRGKDDEWSRLMQGVVRITAPANENFAFMDRVTRLNANSSFSEVLEFKGSIEKGLFAFSTYSPKLVEYLGLFITSDEKLQQLTPNQYTFDGCRIILNKSVKLPYIDENNPLTATIRYIHAPVFHIFEHHRESVDNYRWNGAGEVLQHLPTLALARRAHDFKELERLSQGILLDNSYDDSFCENNSTLKQFCG